MGVVAAAPAVALLVPLAALAAFIVAWGIVVVGQAFVDALFGILNAVLKYSGGGLVFRGGNWLLGKIGLAQANPVNQAHQWLADKLGAAADELGQAIAVSWNALASVVSTAGMAIWHTALVVQDLYEFVHNPGKLAKLLIKTSAFVLAFKWIHDRLDADVNVTNVTQKFYNNVASSPIGAAIRVTVKPATVQLDKFRAWTRAQIARLDQAVAHAGGEVIRMPGAGAADLRGLFDKLKARVARIDTKGLAYIGAGVFVATLARFGLNWLRCDRVKTAGRGICRMDADALAGLLAGTTVIVGSISIETLTRELQGSMGFATDAVTGFVREA